MLPSSRPSLNPRGHRPSLASEYWGFLRQTAKWWLIPIVVVTLVLGLLVLLSTTGAAPFIYTLF
jgi:Family of unknown function (DUF5989)